jgi:sugar lactone lactonase YvrE
MKKLLLAFIIILFGLQGNAQIITTIAGTGTQGYSGDGGQATNAEFYRPAGICFDAVGNYYIADEENSVIRKILSTGIISTIAGNGTEGYSGDGGQATNAGIYNPSDVAIGAFGNLYITDYYNARIRVVNTNGIISTIAGTGTVGYSGDGGEATSAELREPVALTFDGIGNLYIADAGNNRIRMVNTLGIINTIAGTGTAGYSGDGGQATTAELNDPAGIVFDTEGNLYIADAGNNRIRIVNTAGIISTIAGNGTADYSGDGGQATTAELNYPFEVTFDGAGNLYIVDSHNMRIRMVNTTGIISTIAGNGTAGFGGDGGQATGANIDEPAGVVFDAVGNLFIADWANNRIRKVSNVGQAGIAQLRIQNEEFRIYPNPAKDVLNIECLIVNENSTLVITDMLGNTVKQVVINSNQLSINVANLCEGVYNISLHSNEGVVNKRLVIVR